MTSLPSLIERIEAATEGSRELDAAIALVMNLPREAFGPVYDQRGMIDGPEYHVEKGTWSGNGMTWRAPDYTTSIDAALALLPEGYAVTNLMIWPEESSSVMVVGTTRRPFGEDHRMSWVHGAGDGTWKGNGATAPLALLAAILRARQTEGRHDES